MKMIVRFLLSISAVLTLGSCIEDGFTTSPSDTPVFSEECIDMGDVFTEETTPTSRVLIHNRNNKSLLLSEISLSGPDAEYFQINVDGSSTPAGWNNLEIRAKDSVFVLIQATLPERGDLCDEFSAQLDVRTNGVVTSLPIVARGVNVTRLRGETLDSDTRLTAVKPYQIYDSLVVAEGATLTLEPGTTLHFHDKAELIVRGTLISEGTVEEPVVMKGDRTGNVVSDISFDIMSRQWTGVFFTRTSTGNRLKHTMIRNTVQGVTVNGNPESDYSSTPQLTLLNCILNNSAGYVLEAYRSRVKATGCQFSEAGDGLIYLQGGKYRFDQSTFSNNYLFAAISGPAIQFGEPSFDEEWDGDTEGLPESYIQADFTNSIIYGIGSDLSHGDLEGYSIYFRNCLFKSEGTDDDNFINCIWGEDPLFYTDRLEYVFDYRLRPDSPATGMADSSLSEADAATDLYGNSRGNQPDLGAYVFTLPEEDL